MNGRATCTAGAAPAPDVKAAVLGVTARALPGGAESFTEPQRKCFKIQRPTKIADFAENSPAPRKRCRCLWRRASHDPVPRACALLLRVLPRGQAVASALVDVPSEAAPARRPTATPSSGDAPSHSSPSFQRPLGAPAPHGRCAHPYQPLAHLDLDPGDPARAP